MCSSSSLCQLQAASRTGAFLTPNPCVHLLTVDGRCSPVHPGRSPRPVSITSTNSEQERNTEGCRVQRSIHPACATPTWGRFPPSPGKGPLRGQGVTDCPGPRSGRMPRGKRHPASRTFFLRDGNSTPALAAHALRSLALFGRCYRRSALNLSSPRHCTARIAYHGNTGSRKRHLGRSRARQPVRLGTNL